LIESLRDNITRAFLCGYMELEDGWITPFNGYQYTVIDHLQTWDESRSVCQSWRGDLIVYGFRDHSTIVTIKRALRLTNYGCLFGLNDKESERNWKWVNGDLISSDDNKLWVNGYAIIHGEDRDCGIGTFDLSTQFLAFGEFCSSRSRAICEKLIWIKHGQYCSADGCLWTF